MLKRTKEILIIDDDDANVYSLRKAFREFGTEDVESVGSIVDASKFMVGLAPFEYRALPEIILVNFGFAGMSGIHFITWLKRNPLFSKIPLVVYHGSNEATDRETALSSGATVYYPKTEQEDQLREMVEEILRLGNEQGVRL